MKIPRINLGVDRSYGNQPIKFPVSTTADFGFCQPVFSQFLAPTESLKVQAKQLIRNAVMPCPTFCDIKSVNKACFIPMSDVYPGFDALMAQQPINGDVRYVPSSVPQTHNPILLRFLLRPEFSRVTYYGGKKSSQVQAGDSYETPVMHLGAATSWKSLFSHYYGDIDSWDFSPLEAYSRSIDDITFENADFVFTNPDNLYLGSEPENPAFCCVRLTREGSHLAKIFYGLGYSLEVTDTDALSILPLLAFYKAWFDTYCPSRYINWHGTNAYNLIRYVYNNGSVDVDGTGSDVKSLFESFLFDLANCYYTDKDDFVSAHTDVVHPNVAAVAPDGETGLNRSYAVDLDNADISQNQRSISVGSSVIRASSQGVNVPVNSFNEVTLRTLYKLTKYINKDDIIGRNVQKWVRTHYGADTCEDMFRQVYDLGTFVVNSQVDEIYSTSDTVNGSRGEHLGSYAGKGIGFGTGKIHFKADTFGYVIVMQSIVCNSDYFQGNDTSLYAHDRYTFPSREFDALGTEVTSKAAIIDCLGFDNGEFNYVSKGFGFVPRFSGLKVHKAILNGSMRLRGDFDTYSPYHSCKIVRPYETSFDGDKGYKCQNHHANA